MRQPQSGLRRFAPDLAMALALVAAPWVLPLVGAGPDLLSRVLIWGLFGLGFDLLFGYTGLLSFGQAAFYGLGGFVTAYTLTAESTPHLLVALALGTASAWAAGLVIGYLTLRRTGIYFAMSTLAFAEMFFFLENSPLKAYTGGDNGIAGVPPPVITLGSFVLPISSGWPMYAFLATIFFGGYVIARRIVHSPFGAVLTAIRGNAVRAAAVGHSVSSYKLAVFVIAAGYGGLAGGLLGIFQSYMPPDALTLDTSGQLVIQTVIGGAGTLVGPLIGAWVWLYLYETLQGVAGMGAYWKLILGLLFVVLVIVFRRGIAGAVLGAWRRTHPLPPAVVEDGKVHPPLVIVRPETPSGTAPVLEAKGLTKRYGGLTAVNDVSFTLREGEMRGLIGPNGAGKSTFFKMLAGEVRPSSGSVHMRGRDVTGLGATRICQLGMSKSYQINQLFESLTVSENLVIPVLARSRGRFRPDMLRGVHRVPGLDEQVQAAMALINLGHRANTPVHELAYGEKRRLEIGLALATGANILLLDEPLAGMSPEERVHVVALLKAVRGGRTMVIVEHDMDAMFELAEHITVLHEGRLLADGRAEDIQRDPAVQDAYLGGIHGS